MIKLQAMRKFWRSRRFWGVAGYVLLLAAIVGSGLLLGRYKHNAAVKRVHTSSEALRSSVTQVYLGVSGLQNIDGSLPVAAQAMSTQQASLQASINEARDILAVRRSQLDPAAADQLKAALDSQQQLLDAYSARYKALGKAISYDPRQDLDLDLDKNLDTVKARAGAAYASLDQLAQSQSLVGGANSLLDSQRFTLSDSSYQALSAIAQCFKQISDSKSQAEVQETRQRCSASYPAVRKTLAEQVTEVFSSKDAQDKLAVLQGVLKKL